PGVASHCGAARGSCFLDPLCDTLVSANHQHQHSLPARSAAYDTVEACRPVHTINRDGGRCPRLAATLSKYPGTAASRRVDPAGECTAYSDGTTRYPPHCEVRWRESPTRWG